MTITSYRDTIGKSKNFLVEISYNTIKFKPKQIIDKEIQLEVCGDLEEAKRFNLNDAISFDDEESDSGNDDENENENYKKKKSKSKTSKKKVTNREKLFTCFPLTCKIRMRIQSNETTFNIVIFGIKFKLLFNL
jgi:hypothetical protein